MAATLLVATALLSVGTASAVDVLGELTREFLQRCGQLELNPAELWRLAVVSSYYLGLILVPFFLVLVVTVLVVDHQQDAIQVSWQAIRIDFSKLNPVSGLTRMFSPGKQLVSILQNLAKVGLIGYVVYLTVRNEAVVIPQLAMWPLPDVLAFTGDVAMRMLWRVGMVACLIAVIDYALTKHRYEESLKMTKQEVKEEFKMLEGDPLVKGKIRQIQRERALRRMLQAVPEADVVITNPVHYAVALRYNLEQQGGAPVVVAKGQRKLAQRIKEIAREHGVPVIENPPVARALYAGTEVGEQIPFELYQAVAEILAHVYKMKGLVHG